MKTRGCGGRRRSGGSAGRLLRLLDAPPTTSRPIADGDCRVIIIIRRARVAIRELGRKRERGSWQGGARRKLKRIRRLGLLQRFGAGRRRGTRPCLRHPTPPLCVRRDRPAQPGPHALHHRETRAARAPPQAHPAHCGSNCGRNGRCCTCNGASRRDAARSRPGRQGVLRVLRERVLVRSTPASLLACVYCSMEVEEPPKWPRALAAQSRPHRTTQKRKRLCGSSRTASTISRVKSRR